MGDNLQQIIALVIVAGTVVGIIYRRRAVRATGPSCARCAPDNRGCTAQRPPAQSLPVLQVPESTQGNKGTYN